MVAWVGRSTPLLQESVEIKHHPTLYIRAEDVSNTSVQSALATLKIYQL